MKPEPTDERRALIRQIMKLLGPNTSPLSRDLTEAELHEQTTEFLQATLHSAQPKRQQRANPSHGHRDKDP